LVDQPEEVRYASVRYDHLPFFYSDLFELGYEAVGEVDSRLEMVMDWKEKLRTSLHYTYNFEGFSGFAQDF